MFLVCNICLVASKQTDPNQMTHPFENYSQEELHAAALKLEKVIKSVNATLLKVGFVDQEKLIPAVIDVYCEILRFDAFTKKRFEQSLEDKRMQRKGSMLVNYSPLPDHALPNFFRPVSFFFSRLAKCLFPTLYHTLCPAPYIHPMLCSLNPRPYSIIDPTHSPVLRM